MAIIDSVVMGSAKNKVGEVTLSVIKGRTIARKYQRDVANPNTPGQVRQRNKMHNNVLLYQMLQPALEKAFLQKGKYQSQYNAFVSANINIMPDDKNNTGMDVFSATEKPITVAKGSLAPVTAVSGTTQVEVLFNDAVTEMKPGDKLYIASYSSEGTIQAPETITLTQNTIASGYYTQTKTVPTTEFVITYWYRADQSKVSTATISSR